jgi:hypothetical protein
VHLAALSVGTALSETPDCAVVVAAVVVLCSMIVVCVIVRQAVSGVIKMQMGEA